MSRAMNRQRVRLRARFRSRPFDSLQNEERSPFANLPGMHRRIPGSRFRQITHRPVKYTTSEVLVLAMLISISQLSGLDV